MTNEYEDRIKDIKDNLDKAKTIRIRAEARMDELVKQQKAIMKELKGMNVDPDKLEETIADLKNEIEDMLDKVDKMIPYDLLEDNKEEWHVLVLLWKVCRHNKYHIRWDFWKGNWARINCKNKHTSDISYPVILNDNKV